VTAPQSGTDRPERRRDYRAEEARDLLRRQNAPDPLLAGLVHHGLYQADSVLAVLAPLHRAGRIDDRAVLALAEAFLWKKDYRNAQALLDGAFGQLTQSTVIGIRELRNALPADIAGSHR